MQMIPTTPFPEKRALGWRVLIPFVSAIVSLAVLAACSDAPTAAEGGRGGWSRSAAMSSTVPLSVTLNPGDWGNGTGSYYVCPNRTFLLQANITGGVPPYYVEWYLPIATPEFYRESTYSAYPIYTGMTTYPRGYNGEIEVIVRDSTLAGAYAYATMVVNPNPC